MDRLERVVQVLGVDEAPQIVSALDLPPSSFLEEQLCQKLEITKTTEGCWDIYRKSDIKRVKKRALEIILSRATILEDCQKVYDASWVFPEIRAKALKEIESILSQRLKNATLVYECDRIYWKAPKGSQLKTEAIEKIRNILTQELAEATTYEECLHFCNQVKESSPLYAKAQEKKELILSQDLERATTIEECLEVYRRKGNLNFQLAVDVEKKIEYFLVQELEKATTLEQCLEIYQKDPRGYSQTKDEKK